jgi:PhnB protein
LEVYYGNTLDLENGYKKNDIYFMIPNSLAPWLTVADGARAFEFYTAAFGAVETYRLEAPDGSLILRLSVGDAGFWVSGGPVVPESPTGPDTDKARHTDATSDADKAPDIDESPARPDIATPLGANTIRMILTVPDPDPFFARALKAGAVEVFPVGEGHGWRLGRLIDPFGLHWEIGHPLG